MENNTFFICLVLSGEKLLAASLNRLAFGRSLFALAKPERQHGEKPQNKIRFSAVRCGKSSFWLPAPGCQQNKKISFRHRLTQVNADQEEFKLNLWSVVSGLPHHLMRTK